MSDFQVIATTATLREPVEHMRRLTGMDFVEVGEAENGAPAHGLSIRHVDGPEYGATAERAAVDTVTTILAKKPAGSGVIAYMDSRQGVERVVRGVGAPGFLPYRQGYAAEDHRRIEAALRDGRAEGVGTTSALEAGIHLPQFAFGLTVSVPASRKSLRQRVGRIGRTGPGVFFVQAPRAAFAKLGDTLEGSFSGPVEASPLYLGNQYILFQQACCYFRETEDGIDGLRLDEDLDWPADFARYLEYAKPGSPRPADLDDLARIGIDHPHRTFGLRALPSVTYALKDIRTRETIGTIDQCKALREAGPGMTYVHMGRTYRVLEWRTSPYDASIDLLLIRNGSRTQAILRSQVGVSTDPDALIDGRHLASENGALIEARLRVVQSAEGYRLGSTAFLYRDLKERDRRMTRKQREYQTTGVVVQIDDDWFAGTADHQLAVRRNAAAAFKAVLVHTHGIAPADVECAHTGIAVHTAAGARKIDNAIVVYDTVSGGLRLTAPLFSAFREILEQLQRSLDLAGSDALLNRHELTVLENWYHDLEPAQPTAVSSSGAEEHLVDGRHLVLAPGSRVLVSRHGRALEYELGEPQLVALGDTERLMYSYDAGDGVQAWVAAEHVRPAGNDWRRARWDSVTGVLELLEVA